MNDLHGDRNVARHATSHQPPWAGRPSHGPEHTLLRTLDWAPAGGWQGLLRALRDVVRAVRRSGPGKRRGRMLPPGGGRVVRLADLGKHPLDSGDFQLEDMWICEKIQRNLHSPKYQVGPMAEGPGAESPVTHFQRSVLGYLEGMAGEGVE